jgi:hypothetical protein
VAFSPAGTLVTASDDKQPGCGLAQAAVSSSLDDSSIRGCQTAAL